MIKPPNNLEPQETSNMRAPMKNVQLTSQLSREKLNVLPL